MSFVRLERLTGARAPYVLDIPVRPGAPFVLTHGVNIARTETDGHSVSEVFQSENIESVNWEFRLCEASFYDSTSPLGLKAWWETYVIAARQMWAYVTYEPHGWVRLPMAIMNDSIDCNWREGKIRFDFALSLVERFLVPGEGDMG